MRKTLCARGVHGPPLCLDENDAFSRFVRATAGARRGLAAVRVPGRPFEECYLVDPASSHMLVSKIKPCMCKYELIQTVKLRMAH